VGAGPDGGRVQVAERLDWLSRDTLGNRPQLDEQLAAFYRRTGHDEDARRVVLAKQRHVRTTLNLPGRIFSSLLDWTVATHWLAVALIAVGWVLATAVIAGITRAVRRD
jgi:hypothetical protein